MRNSTVDGVPFRQRSGTGTSVVSRMRESDSDLQTEMRMRAGSESRSQGCVSDHENQYGLNFQIWKIWSRVTCFGMILT